jgi:cyclopropane fatty-acyl-phospholipid synthase-like methyltransferase
MQHPELERAMDYVGNPGQRAEIVGELQLELLKQNGCREDSQVLEIGCGCLIAGLPIMRFLRADRYVGIDPNSWLIDAARREIDGAEELIGAKRAVFLHNDDFDASSTGRKFDFVISHSILSHAAAWQLPQFLSNTAKVLTPEGVIVASIRFHDETNSLAGDSGDQNWVYPGVSYFSFATVERCASECGLAAEWRSDYREFFTHRAPSNYHDWIRLTRVK